MIRFAISTAAALLGSFALAADWPQWMGPNRNGVWNETEIVSELPSGGPRKLWSAPIQAGYSGPAVVAGKVYVVDFVKSTGEPENNPSKRSLIAGKERIHCFDTATGKQIWSHEYPCEYSVSYPCGPRCTPTVSSGRVYSLGTMGHLCCLDAATGKLEWESDFKAAFKAEVPMWGDCSHPLVHGDKLICVAGGADHLAVAFDKNTGKLLWHGHCVKEQGYCPPTVIRNGNQEQILFWHAAELLAVDPADGKKLWSVKLEPSYGMAINAPQQAGDIIFASGIGGQAVALKFQLGVAEPTEHWRGKKDTAVYSSNATPIIHKGTIYGCCTKGILRAVDLATGERLWENEALTGGKPQGTAFLVRNGERYFAFCETGELVICELNREKYHEISRAAIIEPTGEAFGRKIVWSHPAFADRCIFVRNDKEIACFSLAK